MSESLPEAAAQSGQASLSIMDGLRAFGGGVGFVIITPSVWGYALVPAVVALVLTAGVFALGVWGAFHLGGALFGEPAGVWGKVGSWLVIVLLGVMALVAAILASLCLAQPLSGFALDAIVYAQERGLTGCSSSRPNPLAAMLRTFRVAVVTLVVGGPILAALFLVNWLFPPAVVVTVPLKMLVCGWLMAWNFLDYPLGIRGLGIRARLKWVERNFDAFTIFGLAWAVFTIVPGMILLVLPMGVAGATRLVVHEEQADLIPH